MPKEYRNNPTTSIDRERMTKALKSRMVAIPKGLSREEKRQFIVSHQQ